jgi:hypothetical protein
MAFSLGKTSIDHDYTDLLRTPKHYNSFGFRHVEVSSIRCSLSPLNTFFRHFAYEKFPC